MNKSDLSLENLYEKLIQFEEDKNLFSKKIANVLFWERIRFQVFRLILQERIYFAEVEDKVKKERSFKLINYFLKFRNYLVAIFQMRRNPFLVKEHDIILFSNSRRKKQEDGYWWDIYTDHLEKELNYSTILFEKDIFLKYRKPVKTENMVYLTFLDLLVDLKRYLRRSRVKMSDEEKQYLKKISAEIRSQFGCSIDLENIVCHNLTIRKRVMPYYQKLISKIKPKAAIIVCSYGKEDFIEICKLNKIPVIELQHGVMTRYHVGYSYEKNSAKKSSFPDYLFTFGKYWEEAVSYPISKEKIVNVGFPELEIRKQQYQFVKKKKQILFISQKTIGLKLSKFAVELSQVRNFDYRIIYKLHPFEVFSWKEDYPWLMQSNIEVVDHQGVNLYQLFAESEVLVGVYSTAIYEGLSFHMRTFLVDLTGIDYLEHLIQAGIVTKVSKPEELVSVLSDKSAEQLDAELFFKTNSINNIKEELNKIVSKI